MKRRLTEAQFQAQVVDLAEFCGWLVWHDLDSRRNAAGWPDLVLAKPGLPLLLWELKSARGKASDEQLAWLDCLSRTDGIDVRLLRPADWPTIQATLTARGARQATGDSAEVVEE